MGALCNKSARCDNKPQRGIERTFEGPVKYTHASTGCQGHWTMWEAGVNLPRGCLTMRSRNALQTVIPGRKIRTLAFPTLSSAKMLSCYLFRGPHLVLIPCQERACLSVCGGHPSIHRCPPSCFKANVTIIRVHHDPVHLARMPCYHGGIVQAGRLNSEFRHLNADPEQSTA